MHRFDLKKLKSANIMAQCKAKISNRYAGLKNLDANLDNNKTWKNITEKIIISAKESIGH
jgi:hypothetical protein